MFALSYARHVPAHARVGRFVADEPRLSFAFPFLHEHAHADVLVTGGTTRDAILGRVPRGIHLIVRGIPEEELKRWLRARNVSQDLDIRIPESNIWDSGLRRLERRPHHTLPLTNDLARRDATVNAMAYSLRDGMLHDPFRGLTDIESRTLRTIGNPHERFHEDPLRILRFLRLAAELEFHLEEEALAAIHALGGSLNRLMNDEEGRARYHIPRVHLGSEFVKAMTHAPARAVTHLFTTNVMAHLSPELHELTGMVTPHGVPGSTHAAAVLKDLEEHAPPPGVTIAALAALLEDERHHVFQKLLDRLHITHLKDGEEIIRLAHFLLKHRHVLSQTDPEEMSLAQFEHVFGGERGNHLLTFLHALAVSGGHDSLIRERWHQAKRRKEAFGETPVPLVRGRDLLSLGLSPGPHVRVLQEKIRNEQLQGNVRTKAEALEFARGII